MTTRAKNKKWSLGEVVAAGAVGVGAVATVISLVKHATGASAPKGDQPPANLTEEMLGNLIQGLVEKLDASEHQKNWGMVGLDVLETLVAGFLPAWAGKLLDIVYTVERDAIENRIAATSKRSEALQRARAHYTTRKAN